jgi:hypothetical protein
MEQTARGPTVREESHLEQLVFNILDGVARRNSQMLQLGVQALQAMPM